jgi:hypothetical protein
VVVALKTAMATADVENIKAQGYKLTGLILGDKT